MARSCDRDSERATIKPMLQKKDRAGQRQVLACGAAGAGKNSLIACFADTGLSIREFDACDHVADAFESDLALAVIDAVDGLTSPARHEICLLSQLGFRNVVVAINKMDQVDFSGERFGALVDEIGAFLDGLDFDDVRFIPVTATEGINIQSSASQMPWHDGPALLPCLESIDRAPVSAGAPFRFVPAPVGAACSRGIEGTVLSGSALEGDEIAVIPAGATTRVEQILKADGDAVTLAFSDDISIGPDDVVCNVDAPAEVSDQIAAHIVWLDTEPMLPGRTYLLEIGNQSVTASISELKYKLNVYTLEHQAAKTLQRADLGFCNLTLSKAIVFDPRTACRATSGFTLIDRLSRATVGAGTIEFGLRRATNIRWQALDIDKSVRAELKGQKPCVLWFTGLSGSGKSTVASLLEKQLHARGQHTYVLDGDNVRHGLNKDLGFTDADRVENIRRVAETAKLFVDAGLIVMVSFISPFRSERRMARELFANDEFLEVFVDTPLNICEQRDPKGLYKKARAGEIKNFTGIDSAYEVPERADIVLRAGVEQPGELVSRLLRDLEKFRFI
jgi:bifunctional enzyme CysN/CysC